MSLKVERREKITNEDIKLVKKWTYSNNGRYIQLSKKFCQAGTYSLLRATLGTHVKAVVFCVDHSLSTNQGTIAASMGKILANFEYTSHHRLCYLYSESVKKLGRLLYVYGSLPVCNDSTPSGVWYRPLDVIGCLNNKATIVLPKVDGVDEKKEWLPLATLVYRTKIDHSYRSTDLEDFKCLAQRKWCPGIPTANEWRKLDSSSYIWLTVVDKDEVKLIFSFYLSPMKSNRKTKDVILSFVERSGDIPDDKSALPYLQSMLGILAERGYNTVHGVRTGVLSDLLPKLRMIQTSVTYISGIQADPSEVSLLY